MAKVLCLAPSGFGKSTSIGNIPELGIKGLNPEETYIVSVTSKPLPFKGSAAAFPIAKDGDFRSGKRIVTDNAKAVEEVLTALASSPFKNVVIDDFNYIMQNWYMANALAKGWDAPKQIGFFMGRIFDAIEKIDFAGKNVFILAHGEPVPAPDGRIYLKMKTTGKMVDEYVTPEGKFDVTLLGISRFDSTEKKVVKEFLTNENEQYSSAKSPIGMFDKQFIPNDLGYITDKIAEYYG
jgi:hypothetical protein